MRINRSYWAGFCACLLILAVAMEVFVQFYNSVDLDVMKRLGQAMLFWLPIYMVGTSIIGFVIIFYAKDELSEGGKEK